MLWSIIHANVLSRTHFTCHFESRCAWRTRDKPLVEKYSALALRCRWVSPPPQSYRRQFFFHLILPLASTAANVPTHSARTHQSEDCISCVAMSRSFNERRCVVQVPALRSAQRMRSGLPGSVATSHAYPCRAFTLPRSSIQYSRTDIPLSGEVSACR